MNIFDNKVNKYNSRNAIFNAISVNYFKKCITWFYFSLFCTIEIKFCHLNFKKSLFCNFILKIPMNVLSDFTIFFFILELSKSRKNIVILKQLTLNQISFYISFLFKRYFIK